MEQGSGVTRGDGGKVGDSHHVHLHLLGEEGRCGIYAFHPTQCRPRGLKHGVPQRPMLVRLGDGEVVSSDRNDAAGVDLSSTL